MSRHHYLPAGFIGRFANGTSQPTRNRCIAVKIVKTHKVHTTTPARIGAKKGLYNLTNGQNIDKWKYENQLQRVLDSIASGQPLMLDDYLRVAVPFVTGLFVRGKEFNIRYENIPVIKHATEQHLIHADNTNMSRTMRLQKLLSPVLAARWVVLHNTNDRYPIISNDLGLTMTLDMLTGDTGWAIPLDTRTILGLFPRKERHIATYHSGVWYADIEHLYPAGDIFHDLNAQIALNAYEFVFGPNKELFESLRVSAAKQPDDLAYIMEAPWARMFTRDEYNRHDFEWFYAAAIANKNITPFGNEKYIFKLEDVGFGSNKWSPTMVIIPGGQTQTGITFREDKLHIDLS